MVSTSARYLMVKSCRPMTDRPTDYQGRQKNPESYAAQRFHRQDDMPYCSCVNDLKIDFYKNKQQRPRGSFSLMGTRGVLVRNIAPGPCRSRLC